jgi:hypothetical protein
MGKLAQVPVLCQYGIADEQGTHAGELTFIECSDMLKVVEPQAKLSCQTQYIV